MSILEEVGLVQSRTVRRDSTKQLTATERQARHEAQRNRWVGDGRVDRHNAAGDRIKPDTTLTVAEAKAAMIAAGEAPRGQQSFDKSFVSHSGSKGRRRPDPEPEEKP
jgi:hypothetical protein